MLRQPLSIKRATQKLYTESDNSDKPDPNGGGGGGGVTGLDLPIGCRDRFIGNNFQDPKRSRAGSFKHSMGARNRVELGLSNRIESFPGLLKSLNFGLRSRG